MRLCLNMWQVSGVGNDVSTIAGRIGCGDIDSNATHPVCSMVALVDAPW
jgi:hypothetical protein